MSISQFFNTLPYHKGIIASTMNRNSAWLSRRLATSLVSQGRVGAYRYLSAPAARRTPPQQKTPPNPLWRVGAPFVLFSVLAAWVVSNALDGKLREMEASQGKTSQSIRQAALEQEHEDMMERLNKIVASDFDNTKRIKRPHEILEERRLERERRNAWHRRWYRSIFGEGKNEAAEASKK